MATFSPVIKCVPNRTLPTLMAKVELMSLGENSGEDEKKGGILQHMLGIGTNVQAGDPIAMIKVNPGKEGKENQTVTVYAPQAGTITKFHTPLQSTVAIGDALLELSDDIEKDKKAWQEHMKENKGFKESWDRDHNFGHISQKHKQN